MKNPTPMDNQQYHADTSRISKSGLDLINRSPLHYWQKYLAPDKPEHKQTPALLAGSIFHKLTLEPETFAKEYLVLPPNAPAYPTDAVWKAKNPSAESSKAMEFWRTIARTYPNVQIISQEEKDTASRMRDAVMKHPFARQLFEMGGVAERTVLFNENETGAPCKCRPDFETKEDIVVDLKSTIDASPDEFGRSAYNYRYYVQAPFYLDGINAEAGREKVRHFVFVACEKVPPYGVGVYFIDREAIELGRRDYVRDCATFVACKETNHWPGYGNEAQALRIPTWAYRKNP